MKNLERVLEQSVKPLSWQVELNAALVQAVTSRQPAMVQQLIQAGAAVPHHSQSYPLLFVALDLKEFESFQMLLSHTPETVIRDTLYSTSGSLFHAAVRSGNLDIVKQVAEIFVGLSLPLDTAECVARLTPLHIAVRWLSAKPGPVQWFSKDKSLKQRKQAKLAGNVKDSSKRKMPKDIYGGRNDSSMKFDTSIVEYILSKGANVNAADKNGRTPLHEAAIIGCEPLVRILLDYKADASIVDDKQHIPWMYAIIFHRDTIRSLLEERSDITTCHAIGGRSVLHLACASGCVESVKVLLSRGMDLCAVSDEGLTPLMEAVKHPNLNCVKYLLSQKDCDVNQSCNNATALSLALQELNSYNSQILKILSALKEVGADLNQCDASGNTLLLTYFDNEDVRNWLLENGANINVVGADVVTCLWLAVKKSGQEAVDIVSQLMNLNVNMYLADQVTVEDGTERTPFQHAVISGNHELCTLFLNAGCRGYKLKTWLQSDDGKEYLSNMHESMKPVIQRIEKHVFKPRRLEDTCRQAVLASLGSTEVERKIGCLPLPQLLKIQMKWPVFLQWKQACYNESVDA